MLHGNSFYKGVNLAFETANDEGWNGNNQRTGAEEPTGMYYYTVRLQFQTGLVVEKQGFFYLIR